VVTASLAKSLLARARSLGIPAIVDSKSSDIGHFGGCAVFKSNRHELEAVVQRELQSERECEAAARLVSRALGGATVVVTDGERGILYVDSDGNYYRATPPRGRAIKSVIGAGDTVTASLALASAVGMDLADVIDLALHAAAEAVANADTTAVRGHICG
jgi:D-beta-D-heptose 7-phosphate kinase/D-beta-D-heptose 1-phosphate adenosyltransferase